MIMFSGFLFIGCQQELDDEILENNQNSKTENRSITSNGDWFNKFVSDLKALKEGKSIKNGYSIDDLIVTVEYIFKQEFVHNPGLVGKLNKIGMTTSVNLKSKNPLIIAK